MNYEMNLVLVNYALRYLIRIINLCADRNVVDCVKRLRYLFYRYLIYAREHTHTRALLNYYYILRPVSY